MNEARLYEILRLKRGAGSIGEQMMIDKQIMPYNPEIFRDPAGNILAYHIKVGTGSKSLFSAHTDTVHGRGKLTTIRPVLDDAHVNDIDLDKETNFVHAKGDVLGADDGAGLWLLLEMIDASVPGSYLLHLAEEVGGVGSRGMATHYGSFLEQFDRAIAFDRKGVHSIITHQGFQRGCSDEFADALADALSCDTYFFGKDDGGVFTDTANYTDHIGETTNVSIGYYSEHTHGEKLNLHFLFNMRDQCVCLDWENLPTKRLPAEADPDYNKWPTTWSSSSYKGMKQSDWDKEFDYYSGKTPVAAVTVDDLLDLEFNDLLDLVEADPYVAATLMWEMMWGRADDSPGGAQDDEFGADLDDDTNMDADANSFIDRLKVGLA